MTRPMPAALSILLFLSPAMAQDDTAVCDGPQTQSAMTDCAGRAFNEADAALNEAYETAVAKMRGIHNDLPEAGRGATEVLRTAQRAWIAYRDAACETEGFLVRGGSLEPMVVLQCLARLTEARIADLAELLRDY